MTEQKIIEVRQERNRLFQKSKEILETVEKRDGKMTAEERSHYDSVMAEFDTQTEKLSQFERQLQIEREMKSTEGNGPRANPEGNGENREDKRASAEYRTAFEGYVREKRAAGDGLLKDTTTGGAYLVPVSYENAIREKKKGLFVMRSLADVITSGLDISIPMEGDNGEAGWIDELGTYPVNDASVGRKLMEAWKVGRIVKLSEELLQDETVNLEAYLAKIFAYTIGKAEEAAYISGDGTKKPRGVLVDAAVGKTAASLSAITADDILDVFFAVEEQYAQTGSWLLARSTLKAIRKLKNTNDEYIFQPGGLNVGAPDTIERRPVYTSSAMPELGTASAKVIAFGDFKQYQIVDRAGIAIQKLMELYAGTGQIGFKVHSRTDGKLLFADAVKTLALSAT